MCLCVILPYVFYDLRVCPLSRGSEGFDHWLGSSASQHNEHVVREARGTAAQIPTRAAGGESVPDQLYHCVELSPLKGRCHATINTIVVVTLRASVRIAMHMHVTHCELWDLTHKPGGWWCVFKAYSQTSPSTPSSLSVCYRPFSQQTFLLEKARKAHEESYDINLCCILFRRARSSALVVHAHSLTWLTGTPNWIESNWALVHCYWSHLFFSCFSCLRSFLLLSQVILISWLMVGPASYLRAGPKKKELSSSDKAAELFESLLLLSLCFISFKNGGLVVVTA